MTSPKRAPVVVNCVLTRFPIIPCKPILALMNPMHTNESVLVHAGLARESATLPCWLCHIEIAAAIVKTVWMNVPNASHNRVLQPSLSPRRPMKAPKINVSTEQSACWSAIWNE